MAVLAALAASAMLALGTWYQVAGDGSTSLRITVWPRGTPGPSSQRTLDCDPAAGTLARPARACRRLASLDKPFAPTPPNTACTQI
jgi:hypothetical protein